MSNSLIGTGEMARLHDINKKTLMYYDEIGLFSPSVRDERGYRYYDFKQHSYLEVILTLRSMNTPIGDIKDLIKNRSTENLLELLSKKEVEVKNKIVDFQRIQKFLTDKIHALKTYDHSVPITILNCKEENLFIIPSDSSLPHEQQAQTISNTVKKLDDMRLYNSTWGTMLSLDDIENKNFLAYNYLYIKTDQVVDLAYLHVKPKGMYIIKYYKGNWANFDDVYIDILSYVTEHHLRLKGYAYEESIIDDFATEDKDEYVTKVMIAVEDELLGI